MPPRPALCPLALAFLLAGSSRAAEPTAESTHEGCLERGVEGGCWVLKADGTTWELFFRGDPPPEGARISVTGTADPGAASTCMQGTPLEVTSWKKLASTCRPAPTRAPRPKASPSPRTSPTP